MDLKSVELSRITQKLISLVEPTIEDMGYELVRLLYIPGTKKATLQIMIDHKNQEMITVEDCTRVSRAISALLEVEDPIENAYILEVSSPGIDRPLLKLKDFERFKGFQARIELTEPHNGRKRFQGTLLGTKDDFMLILSEGVQFELPYALLKKAKLLLTDELIAHTLSKQKQENS